MPDNCQLQDCGRTATDYIFFSSEWITNPVEKSIRMWHCDKHEDEMWEYLVEHEHFFPIDDSEVRFE